MRKRGKIEVAECIDGEYIFKNTTRKYSATVLITTLIMTPAVPVLALANDGNTFNKIYEASMRVVDAGVVFVIIFAGATWILGNRGKSLELLLGAGAGYLIIRNAVHIRDGLKSLVPSIGGL